MLDVTEDIVHWMDQKEPVVLATVVSTWGSSPRKVGAKMAFTPSGKITGSVSGGCVEGAVYEAGLHTLETGEVQLLHFGVADETAFEVGLACGGQIDVIVHPLEFERFQKIKSEIEEAHSLVIATVIEGPANVKGQQITFSETELKTSTSLAGLEKTLQIEAKTALLSGMSEVRFLDLSTGETVRVFFDVILPPPTLIIVGGAHISVALASIAKTVGYRTVVIDPRKAFVSESRFPDVDQLIRAWPQEAFPKVTLTRSTAVVMLTHDPKIDDPALKIVFESPVFYIGALGSRKTQAARRIRLLEDGISAEQLDRIHGPVGIDLGADKPEEIALAIMAEIVSASHYHSVKA